MSSHVNTFNIVIQRRQSACACADTKLPTTRVHLVRLVMRLIRLITVGVLMGMNTLDRFSTVDTKGDNSYHILFYCLNAKPLQNWGLLQKGRNCSSGANSFLLGLIPIDKADDNNFTELLSFQVYLVPH